MSARIIALQEGGARPRKAAWRFAAPACETPGPSSRLRCDTGTRAALPAASLAGSGNRFLLAAQTRELG